MRVTRIVGALLVVVLTLSLGQALLHPAHAAKPEHDLSARGYEQGASDRFFVKGKVTTYDRGRIRLLRNVSGGKFTLLKRIKVRGSGKFKVRIYQVGRKRTCFKVQVPRTDLHRRTTSDNLGCITRD